MTTPYLTFLGPDSSGTVFIKDNHIGALTPFATVHTQSANAIIHRLYPNGQQMPFATTTASSMSGSCRVQMAQGLEIKMHLQAGGYKMFKMPPGLPGTMPGAKMEWQPGGWSGSKLKLEDKTSKTILAVYESSKSEEGLPRLQVLVQASDPLVDIILATGLGARAQNKQDDKAAMSALKAFGQIAGLSG